MEYLKTYTRKSGVGRRRGIAAVCVLFLACILWVPPLFAAVEISASLNANSFPLDRVATLTVTVSGSSSTDIQIPEVDGIQFHARGKSSQFEMINGSFSSSVVLTYLVQAYRVGKFTIPAITLNTRDGLSSTQPIRFEVTSSGTRTAISTPSQTGTASTRLRSGEADKVAFMRVTPEKKTSYSGEILPVQIKVYFRDGIKANLNSLPQLSGEGFVLQQLEREPVQTREMINNTRYSVLTWNSALSGIKEGKHTVSLELEATLLVRQQRHNARSMFNDPFFGSFFDSSYSEKQVTVASPKMELTVLGLPEKDRPADFAGAIGEFSLKTTAVPLEVEPGDPVTLTTTISGHGNFDRVQAPKLVSEDGWKTYTPSSEFLKDGSPGRGKKVFEQALVARKKDVTEVPAVSFSYFDPRAKRYETITSAPIPFTVKGIQNTTGESQSRQKEQSVQQESRSVPAPAVTEPPLKTLAPLHLGSGDMDGQITPLFNRLWFRLLGGVLLLGLTTVIVLRAKAARFAANPVLQRDQAMKHLLALREKEIAGAQIAADSRRFLALCRTAIQEQLGLLWETEAGAITLADLQRRLPENSGLITIFTAAEQSAYSGQELSAKEMQKFTTILKKELEGLV